MTQPGSFEGVALLLALDDLGLAVRHRAGVDLEQAVVGPLLVVPVLVAEGCEEQELHVKLRLALQELAILLLLQAEQVTADLRAVEQDAELPFPVDVVDFLDVLERVLSNCHAGETGAEQHD